MCLSVMDISGAERRALQTWRLRLGQQKAQFPSCCVENCCSWKAAARHPGWFACAATERRPARGVPVATKEAAGIETELTARGRGLGSPRPPAPPAPPWSPVLRRRAGARAARRLWRTPPDRRAQWMGAGRRSDGRTAAAWGRDEGSACGETAVSSRQCADVFGAGQDSRCVCP